MAFIVEIRPQCDKCHYVLTDSISVTKAESLKSAIDDGWIKKGKEIICEKCQEPENKTNSYDKITDLLFLGDAVDLPYYDFVIGVEAIEPSEGVAYNNGEGESLKQRLINLDRKAILHLSYQPSPPKESLGGLLKKLNVNHIVADIGIAIIDPKESGRQIQFVQTPLEFLDSKGIVEEHPEKLLHMLKQRLADHK